MPTKKFKPVTPGTRFRSVMAFDEITRAEPEKSLLEPIRKSGGRNAHGHVTSRRRGGGARRAYRKIDFKRDKFGVTGKVAHIEYDPNRSANIALIVYADGDKRYILHPRDLKQGDSVVSGPGSDIRIGNAIPLGEVPLGTVVHPVELKAGQGGKMVRSAGNGAQVVARKATTSHCACPRRKSACCAKSAWPRLVRSATSTTSCRCWVKPVRRAGAAAVRRSAVSP
jgi:large subunit ribosomal protein L2